MVRIKWNNSYTVTVIVAIVLVSIFVLGWMSITYKENYTVTFWINNYNPPCDPEDESCAKDAFSFDRMKVDGDTVKKGVVNVYGGTNWTKVLHVEEGKHKVSFHMNRRESMSLKIEVHDDMCYEMAFWCGVENSPGYFFTYDCPPLK